MCVSVNRQIDRIISADKIMIIEQASDLLDRHPVRNVTYHHCGTSVKCWWLRNHTPTLATKAGVAHELQGKRVTATTTLLPTMQFLRCKRSAISMNDAVRWHLPRCEVVAVQARRLFTNRREAPTGHFGIVVWFCLCGSIEGFVVFFKVLVFLMNQQNYNVPKIASSHVYKQNKQITVWAKHAGGNCCDLTYGFSYARTRKVRILKNEVAESIGSVC